MELAPGHGGRGPGPAHGARAVAGAGPGEPTALAEVHVTAGFDMARRLESLATVPRAAWTDAVIGTRAGGGFRRHLEEVVPPEEAGSLLRQVLDDMPAAALISGYGLMRMARRTGPPPRAPSCPRGPSTA